MEIIDLLDKHASAIFGAIGAIFGFFSNYFVKKLDRRNEISKEESKEYFKQKRLVLNESLKLISEYELTIETLHDYSTDDSGVPIKIVTKEDIYEKYFLKIFGYLHANRLYLEKDTIKKLDILKRSYYEYIVGKKIILEEYNDVETPKSLENLTKNLFDTTYKEFNSLNEEVKYDEVQGFRQKVTT